MPHAEIAAIAARHHLPPSAVRELDALFARHSRSSAVATVVEGYEPVVLRDAAPAESDDATDETDERELIASRYRDLGPIGAGGMGEVRRVHDVELNRTLAMKSIRPEWLTRPAQMARFLEEAQVGAQLQHPGVAPVHEIGTLPDGRLFFTMKEVRGQTFTEAIRTAHGAGIDDVALRRLCGVYASVADAVAYAHSRGVLHRDLKPDNVMVGAYGEVHVIDWGLAKVVGRRERAADEEDSIHSARESDALKTGVGTMVGTPAYMAPEQARGGAVDARTDVYALGAMLYEVLAGRPPYEGRDAFAVVRQVLAGPPEPPGRALGLLSAATFGGDESTLEAAPADAKLPADLVALCERAMAREPGQRPSEAGEIAAEVRKWLAGAKRREDALAVVATAEERVGQAADLRQRAAALRDESAVMLKGIEPWRPEQDKAAGWARADEAETLERRAEHAELQREALLQAALTHAPDLPEAHAAIVELEVSRHMAAEAARDTRRVAEAEVRLSEHLPALGEHETARRAAAYLKGDGALTLVTDPPGAGVELFRYERRNRRLVEVPVRSLGMTPVRATPLPMGSYLCVVRHGGCADVRYPVEIARGAHWDGVPPGEREPSPVWLPPRDRFGADDVYVPAGWFWSGGDAEAVDSLSRRRLWCDGLVVKRFPVTNREYVAFLDNLVATGREADAVRHQPRERSAGEGWPVYGRDEAGRFVLRPDADGDVWEPDFPVVLVDWFAATAYAAWLAERTGTPWRLLGELEWEKAARGADGRFYPWGDGFDPSWCCVRASHPGRPLPAVVDSFPVDTSVYGVRGLGGNIEDWCADVFRREGPHLPGDTVVSPSRQGPVTEVTSARCIRGGSWVGAARLARSACRFRFEPGYRIENLGLRVAFRPGPGSQHR